MSLLDLAACCWPARGVGYYRFVPVSPIGLGRDTGADGYEKEKEMHPWEGRVRSPKMEIVAAGRGL